MISRSNSNKTTKFGQLMKYMINNFFKYYAENEDERLVPDQFLFFRKALYEVTGSDQYLSFNTKRTFNCQKLFQAWDYVLLINLSY